MLSFIFFWLIHLKVNWCNVLINRYNIYFIIVYTFFKCFVSVCLFYKKYRLCQNNVIFVCYSILLIVKWTSILPQCYIHMCIKRIMQIHVSSPLCTLLPRNRQHSLTIHKRRFKTCWFIIFTFRNALSFNATYFIDYP